MLGSLRQIQDLDREMQNCIQDCLDCHSICLATAMHCLDMGGKHAAREHITALLACAEACQISANFMLMQSPLHAPTCGVCADACTLCADECERLADGDRQMLACAEVCRRCASSCREMARMAQ